jgi:hypothetical protein
MRTEHLLDADVLRARSSTLGKPLHTKASKEAGLHAASHKSD